MIRFSSRFANCSCVVVSVLVFCLAAQGWAGDLRFRIEIGPYVDEYFDDYKHIRIVMEQNGEDEDGVLQRSGIVKFKNFTSFKKSKIYWEYTSKHTSSHALWPLETEVMDSQDAPCLKYRHAHDIVYDYSRKIAKIYKDGSDSKAAYVQTRKILSDIKSLQTGFGILNIEVYRSMLTTVANDLEQRKVELAGGRSKISDDDIEMIRQIRVDILYLLKRHVEDGGDDRQLYVELQNMMNFLRNAYRKKQGNFPARSLEGESLRFYQKDNPVYQEKFEDALRQIVSILQTPAIGRGVENTLWKYGKLGEFEQQFGSLRELLKRDYRKMNLNSLAKLLDYLKQCVSSSPPPAGPF